MAVLLYMGIGYPDVRGFKWVSAFQAMGFDAVVLRGRGPKGRDVFSSYGPDMATVETVERLDTKFPLDFALARYITKRVALYEPDIILVRDIFLAGYAIYVGSKMNIPCYIDLADNYPEVAKSILRSRLGRQAGYSILNQWERYVLRQADGVVVVTPESKSHIMDKHRLSGSQIFVVENVPKDPDLFRPTKSAFSGNLVYIGTFDRGIRDLDTVIEGLRIYYETSGESVHLTIYAFEPEKVQNVVLERKGGARFVTVLPVVDNDILYQTLRAFDAGIVPHCRCPATEYTAPNKIYDYLHAGIRVICSDNPPLRRILDDIGGGVTYSCGDPMDFAQVLNRLKSAIEGEQCKADTDALASRYEWNVQVEPFLRHLRDILT